MAETFRRRYALFPKHDGKGNIIVEYQDGTSETLSVLDAKVQLDGWLQALGGATVYLAMTQRKD